MRTKIIALMVIMAAQAHAQTLLSYTNVRADVSGGPAFSSSAVAGSFRFTYVVEDTPGVPLNLDDGTTFRLEAWAADGVRAHNVASTNLVSTDLSSGQVRFVVPSIGVGEYRIRGVAQPAGGDTTLVWQITHHMLTVTSAPSAGASYPVSLSLVPLLPSNGLIGTQSQPWGEINAQTARVQKLIAADLDVSGAITAIDTGRVSKLGDTMTGPITNAHGYFGWAGALTGLNWSAISNAPVIPDLADVVTNRGATINGEPITNGAAITVAQSNVGTVQLYTNAVGEIVYTNASGYPIAVINNLAGEAPFLVHRYDSSGEITSNLNIGAITYVVTNGNLIVSLPNEAGSLRIIDYNLITTGRWVRAAVKVNQGAIRAIASSVQQTVWGIAWQRTDGTNFVWGFDHSGFAVPASRLMQFTALYARVYPWIGGAAPYDSNATLTPADALMISADGTYYAIDYDGTNTIRGYFGYGKDSLQLVHVATNVIQTGVQIAGFGVGLYSYSTTAGATNTFLVTDSLEIEQDKLWREAWRY